MGEIGEDGQTGLLSQAVVLADRDGLAAPLEGYRNVAIVATLPNQRCTQTLTSDDVDAPVTKLYCNPR